MIIGSIIEVTPNATPGNTGANGASIMHFYSMKDAINWAVLQSQNAQVIDVATKCLCTVINTDDNTKRWWFNGTEYTG